MTQARRGIGYVIPIPVPYSSLLTKDSGFVSATGQGNSSAGSLWVEKMLISKTYRVLSLYKFSDVGLNKDHIRCSLSLLDGVDRVYNIFSERFYRLAYMVGLSSAVEL
jgi:hypothetical protein